jgi:hypothetical protein
VADDAHLERVWVAHWRRAGVALARQRARELRELTPEQALAASETLLALALTVPLDSRRVTQSGLVEQQRRFHRRAVP